MNGEPIELFSWPTLALGLAFALFFGAGWIERHWRALGDWPVIRAARALVKAYDARDARATAMALGRLRTALEAREGHEQRIERYNPRHARRGRERGEK